jgi:RNA polymerase sigma factor (sigma-70 family)
VNEINPTVYDLVPSVARTIHRRFSNWVELQDVNQECYHWVISRANWINEMLGVEDLDQRKHNEQRIAYQMRRAAERYSRKEKAIKSGYHITDEAYYESATIAQLLPFVIASVVDGTVLEQAQEMIRDGQPKGSSSPSEGGNLLATLIDIKKKYLKLEERDRNILALRYHENLTLAQIAAIQECAVSTADKRCQASLRKLLQSLGGESPYR